MSPPRHAEPVDGNFRTIRCHSTSGKPVLVGLGFWLPYRARQAGADVRRRLDTRHTEGGRDQR